MLATIISGGKSGKVLHSVCTDCMHLTVQMWFFSFSCFGIFVTTTVLADMLERECQLFFGGKSSKVHSVCTDRMHLTEWKGMFFFILLFWNLCYHNYCILDELVQEALLSLHCLNKAV